MLKYGGTLVKKEETLCLNFNWNDFCTSLNFQSAQSFVFFKMQNTQPSPVHCVWQGPEHAIYYVFSHDLKQVSPKIISI